MSEFGNRVTSWKAVEIDGEKIAESTVKQVNSITRQKGRNPIIGYT